MCKRTDSYDTARCLHSCAAILIYESKIRSMEWIVVKIFASYTQLSSKDELAWSPYLVISCTFSFPWYALNCQCISSALFLSSELDASTAACSSSIAGVWTNKAKERWNPYDRMEEIKWIDGAVTRTNSCIQYKLSKDIWG